MIDFLISTLISTILGTLALLVAINIVHERPNYLMAFLASGVANFLPPFILSFIYLPIPNFFMILGALVWILVIKLFFGISWKHSIMIGILGYGINFALNILGVPGLIKLIIF